MSSLTITSSPTVTQSYTTSLAAPVTTTTDLYDIPIDDPIGGAKPVQSYIYPTVAFAVALLVAVQVCRLMERKRLRQRHAMAQALRTNADGDDEDAAFAKLTPPVMYTVYLDKKSWAEEQERTGWEGIMPLASNLVVRPEERNQATVGEPESAIQKTKTALRSFGNGVLIVLDALALYDRFAAEQRRLEAAKKREEEAGKNEVIDPSLPRELITGIMITMPSSSKPSNARQKQELDVEVYEEEQLSDMVIGVMERSSRVGVD